MNDGILSSVNTTQKQNLQVERFRLREPQTSTSQPHYNPNKSWITRILASSPEQKHTSVVMGVRGAGSFSLLDYFSQGADDNGYGNGFQSNHNHYQPFQNRATGAYSVDLCLSRASYNTDRTTTNLYGVFGTYSGIFGGQLLTINPGCTHSVILGGYSNTIGYYVNQAGILGGYGLNAYANRSALVGGWFNYAYGNESAVIAGGNCSTNGTRSVAIGGNNTNAYINYSTAFGRPETYGSHRNETHIVNLTGTTGPNWPGSGVDVDLSTAYYLYNTNQGIGYTTCIGFYDNAVSVATVKGTVTAINKDNNTDIIVYDIIAVAKSDGVNCALLGTPVVNVLYTTLANPTWTFTISTYTNSFRGFRFTVNSGTTNVNWSLNATVNYLSV